MKNLLRLRNKKKRLSLFVISFMLLTLLLPVFVYAMSGEITYNPINGRLSVNVYTSDPTSVTVVTSAAYGGTTSVSTITYNTYTLSHPISGEYDDQNKLVYSVYMNVYSGHKPDSVTLSDHGSIPNIVATGDVNGYTYYYFSDPYQHFGPYRMPGQQYFSMYLENAYLQPGANLVSFNPTQSLTNSLEIIFPKNQTDSMDIDLSKLSTSSFSLMDTSVSPEVELPISHVIHTLIENYSTHTTYPLPNGLIVNSSSDFIAGHTYMLKMSASSAGNEIRLPSRGIYSLSMYLLPLSISGTNYTANTSDRNALFIDNVAISRASSTSATTYNSSTPSPSPIPTPIPIPIVNVTANAATFPTNVVLGKSPTGQSTLDVVLEADTFGKALDQLKDKMKEEQVITIDAGDLKADIFNVTLSASALTNITANNQETRLILKLDGASYEVPIKLLNLQALTNSLGSDATKAEVHISIEKMSGLAADEINHKAILSGFEPIDNPIDFKITIEANGKIKELNNFGKTYVSRTVILNQVVNANETTVLMYDSASGKFTFVPATFTTMDNNKTLVTIKRNGNSTYLIVKSKKTFSDIKKNYAMADMNLLASKMVLMGVTSNEFKPNKLITRAEFTALLVRALGLTVEKAGAKFSDVYPWEWNSTVINTAVKAGLIKGYGDGKFHPNDPITREQMASLISKAMIFSGKSSQNLAQTVTILGKYKDRSDLSSWVRTDIATVTQAGIMQGDNGRFIPKAFADRTQAAVTMKRLLQYLEFMN